MHQNHFRFIQNKQQQTCHNVQMHNIKINQEQEMDAYVKQTGVKDVTLFAVSSSAFSQNKSSTLSHQQQKDWVIINCNKGPPKYTCQRFLCDCLYIMCPYDV